MIRCFRMRAVFGRISRRVRWPSIAAAGLFCVLILYSAAVASSVDDTVFQKASLGDYLQAKPGKLNLHLVGDTRGAFSDVGAAFGMKVSFDTSIPNGRVRLDLQQVSFQQAMNTVALLSHSFWTPVSATEVIVAADNTANRKELERWLMRTFYFPHNSSAQQLTEMATLLRTLFEFNLVTVNPSNRTVTVRGPASMVMAAGRFVGTLRYERPEVMLDVDIYEVVGQMVRETGLALPQQVTMFQVPGATTGSSAPVAQNSLFTFGGGQTRMGLQVPPMTATFSGNGSSLRSISSVTLRASDGKTSTFRLGTRYPVLASSYSWGKTPMGEFSGINYEDLGVSLKAKPAIHEGGMTLELELETAALGTMAFNGIPSVTHRTYGGTINVRTGESAVLAASVSRSEIQSLQGIPGLSNLAVLNNVSGDRTSERDEDEFLIVITPHLLNSPPKIEGAEILIPPH